MLESLLRTSRCPIALDLGASSIRMLQMRPGGWPPAVSEAACWRFPEPVARGSDAWRTQAVEAVRGLLRAGRFRGRRVTTCLSCEDLKIKNVRLPNLSERELQRAVRSEAREKFGCDFAPDQLRYLEAGPVRQGTDNAREVILIGATGDVIERQLSMIQEMGLSPERIEAEPLVLFRPFARYRRRQVDEEEISVVLDLGHTATRVVVARGQDVVLIKTVHIGGKNFIEAISRHLNLSVEDAYDLRQEIMQGSSIDESEKDQGPDSVSWTILDAIRSDAENLSREVALCLRYCSVTFRGMRPKDITLIGGQAHDPAMARLLGEQLGVECRAGRPLQDVDTSAASLGADRRGAMSDWGICAGLALADVRREPSPRKANHDTRRLSA